jgi:hypothetical protein
VDKGWVLNAGRGRWELLGSDGETIHGTVSVEMVQRADMAYVNRAAIHRGWPPLVPGSPWWCCVLVGGPLDGLYEFLDPGLYDDAPAELTFAGQTLVSAQAGAAAGFDPLWPPAVYRLALQACGHGRTCAYPYRYQERSS